LNFAKDNIYWYQHGAGTRVNTDMSGEFLKQILKEMDAAATGVKGPMFHLRFAHAETVARLYNGMNLFTKPVRQGVLPTTFRMNQYLPFMANLHFELYRKGGQQGHNGNYRRYLHRRSPDWGNNNFQGQGFTPLPNNQFGQGQFGFAQQQQQQQFGGQLQFGNNPAFDNVYVRVMLNEKPIIVPGCQHHFCPYNQFKNIYRQLASLKVQQVCSPNQAQNFGQGQNFNQGQNFGQAQNFNQGFNQGDFNQQGFNNGGFSPSTVSSSGPNSGASGFN